MKPLFLDNTEYTEEFVQQIIKDLIIVRDSALKVGHMGYAVSLSHAIAICNHYISNIKDK